MEEIWRDIDDYVGYYKVSNTGKIKSVDRVNDEGRHIYERILSLSNCHGYVSVVLCKNSITKTFMVHRLVAKAFIPNPNNYPCVNHKDENKKNNYVENLEWCTQKQNANYGTRNARAGLGHGKRTIQYDLDGNEIRRWDSTAEACRYYGVTRSVISSACTGLIHTVCGFKWRYENEI